jgi:uncharacterized protein YdhG (YjbR/CyaY superfamily)
MDTGKPTFTTIDDYIATFPEDIQRILQQVRVLIREVAPEATEKISYQMPTFYLKGNLIHFAAFKQHIGVYPLPTGIAAFAEELAQYKNAKGSVQFPLSEPLPLDLIRRIVQFRVEENLRNAAVKAQKK